MIHITNVRDALRVCDAMGSEVRTEILELILEQKSVNLDTLAKSLHLTNGALTAHIRKLSGAGLIRVTESVGKRGIAKLCSVAEDKILIDIDPAPGGADASSFRIPVGAFTEAAVKPHCGLAGENGYIGELDDVRYFTYPDRADAAAVWFTGALTYTLPVPARSDGRIKETRIEFEAGGLTPGAVLRLFLGHSEVGRAELGCFTDRRGVLTPSWFSPALPQYGSLKTVAVHAGGVYLDGVKLSPPPDALTSIRLVSDGMILFSSRFGDYNTDLRCTFLT